MMPHFSFTEKNHTLEKPEQDVSLAHFDYAPAGTKTKK